MNWSPTLAQRFTLTLGAVALLFHGWEKWNDDESITLPVLGAVLLLTGALSNNTTLDHWLGLSWAWIAKRWRRLAKVAAVITAIALGVIAFINHAAEQERKREQAKYEVWRTKEDSKTRKAEEVARAKAEADFQNCLKDSKETAISASRKEAELGKDEKDWLKFWTEYGRQHCEYLHKR